MYEPENNVATIANSCFHHIGAQPSKKGKRRSSTSDLEPNRSYKKIKFNNGTSKKHRRTVFLPTEESSFLNSRDIIHYFIASKTFHQNVNKGSETELPRKKIKNHSDALESIVYISNSAIEKQFEKQRKTFESEGKVDKYGNVPEFHLFHGTTNESINKIVETNFSLDHLPKTRGKLMLFGTGHYFSELPGVSLMYGECLLLCKVLLGKCQRYHPNGQTPPEIPDEFDSRVVIRDGLEVVTVVKKTSQILPFCIVNIKKERIEQSGPIPATKKIAKEEDTDSDRDESKTSPNQEQTQKC